MNDKIKILAEQAGYQQVSDAASELFLQNFTKLVVNWCDTIIVKYSQANMENDSWVEMLDMMQTEIKEHFGVDD